MRFRFRSSVAQSGNYRPDIDGLRAIAVLSVLFFHTSIWRFTGGFVGVDIFFVISGYLITSIIAKDIVAGKFSFASFYERRMRRIFPALFFLISVCLLIAIFTFVPDDFTALAKEVLATTCFVSNFYFLRHSGSGGYFTFSSDLQTLLHTWSLAVEEQFYFLFPGLLLLLVRWKKRRTVQFLLALAIVSFALSIWLTRRHPSVAFYILPSRAWELLMGSLLALNLIPPPKLRPVRELAGIAGLALIACADFLFTSQTTFPGWSAFVPCSGACLIIYAGEEGASWASAVLSFPPLVFIGVISYSLYLWHWPLIVFARYFLIDDLGNTAKVCVICGSFLMAFLSFEFVESPFRGRDSSFSRRQVFKLSLAVSLVCLAIGLTITRTGGLPQRYDAPTRSLFVENTARRNDFPDACENVMTNPHRLTDINLCIIGPNASRKILFWGDSHVQQLYPAVNYLYDEGDLRGRGAIFAVANGCPPTENMNVPGGDFHCDAFFPLVMTRAKEQDIDTVFIGFFGWWLYDNHLICRTVNGECVTGDSVEMLRALFFAELTDQVRRLQSLGKRVIICMPFPVYDVPIPSLEIHNAVFSRFGLTRVAKKRPSPDFSEQILQVSRATGADIFDPRKSLCNRGPCIYQIDGVSIYKDDNHIAASQIGILEPNLEQVLAAPAPPLPISISPPGRQRRP